MICKKCTRLCQFIENNKKLYPDFFNAPVPNFGDKNGQFLIVGLAPGLKGANRTGRPFTADYAGDLLYPTLIKFGWAFGEYTAKADDGLQLKDAQITNAVLCVPPANKALPEEINTCNEHLKQTIFEMNNLKLILSLGSISHKAVIKAFGLKQATYPFKHGALYKLPNGLYMADSYHCSRYNTSTKVLTHKMFEDVFVQIGKTLQR